MEKDDDVEVIKRYFFHLFFVRNGTVLSGMCIFCTYQFFLEFAFFKNVTDVSSYYGSVLLEQCGIVCPAGFSHGSRPR